MTARAGWALVRLCFGALAVIAIASQFVDPAREGSRDPVDFLSYYSLASAILGLVVLLVGAARWREPSTRLDDLIRGEAVVCLVMTGLMHGVRLVDDRAEVLPVVLLIDWVVDPPVAHLRFRTGLLWLAFPAVWVVYTMVRGLLSGWYPYPFLDPGTSGYLESASYVAVLGAGFVLLSFAVVALGEMARTLRARGGRPSNGGEHVPNLVEEGQ